MGFLYDEAFDYNDVIIQNRAVVRDFPQKVKASRTLPTANNNGFVLDNTIAGPAIGQGFMYAGAMNPNALKGTIVATCIVSGGNVNQVGVGAAVSGLTTVDLNDTGNYIEDNNGILSTDFSAAGFVVGQVVKVNGAAGNLKWNGYYRISGISSNGGGSNNRLDLNATDIVGTPGDLSTQSGVTLTPIGAGGYWTVSGTAGVAGLLVTGQRFLRDDYFVAINRTLVDFSAAGNADRFTMTMGDGALTLKHLYAPSTIDFAANSIVTDDGDDFETLGFRAGGGVLVRSATVGGNDGPAAITSIDTSVSTNDRLNTADTLTASANDATAELIPLNATPLYAVEVDFAAASSSVARTDLQPWTAFGIFPGDYVFIGSAVDPGNNGWHFVTDIVTTTQRNDTLILGSVIADELADSITLTGYFVPERFGDQKLSWDEDQTEATLRDADPVNGEDTPVEDIDGNFATQWNWEAPGRVFGQGVALRIFGGQKSTFVQAANQFNITMQTADGFVLSSNYTAQPNSAEKFTILETNPFPFAISSNGEHCRGFMRVQGSIDQPWYTGFGELQAAAGQHPYPTLCGASAAVNTLSPSDIESSYRAWFDPKAASLGDPTSCLFQLVDGTYAGVQNGFGTGATYNTTTSKDYWFTPYVNQINSSDGNPQSNWQGLSLRLRRTLGDEYDLIPVELFGRVPIAAYIKPYGCAFISGEANAGLNDLTVDGVTWLVVQNISLTGNKNYLAFSLE